MIQKMGTCGKCGKRRYIVNKKHGLCGICNKIRLHGSAYTPYKIPQRKPTGELAFFRSLWRIREHKSRVSGRDLRGLENTGYFPNMFAHVLDKKNYPKFRLRPENIWLVHPEEHDLIDQGTEEKRREYEQRWKCDFKSFFEERDRLKELYRNII